MTGALLRRAALATVAWWALAEGAAPSGAGWAVVIAAVAGTALAGLALRHPGARRPRASRLPRFAAHLVARSVAGGLDVAARALSPRGRVDPVVVDVPCGLAEGTGRDLFLALVSVMPGTLVAEEGDGGSIRVHVIDRAMAVHEDLARLEEEVAALMGPP